ncbi:hypothetical protein ACMSX5_003882 [Cronobacter turicensis]|uniref:Uncharacterized protein n=1 Tax=Cronobacter turicensis (strain DSM 18703 / CCUG 55852 / LMG 23827 / z3032) TaxID=693216 RepID=C9Y3I0_CROTZ|nr:membrane protein [Cronobacter turicensis]CBA30510.1 hypothetical protein CTU_19520 [Cronobacter turicensis z3032]EKM0378339.1 hypothetical protein [Cronobacter turicensis]ELY7489390.1 hypothetical protein [Cronobacter turicensis]EMD9178235.1 hypothetical protein [Cronobacter turicensis]MDI6473223.1 hypothetical protein [Cronobacter turicensis]
MPVWLDAVPEKAPLAKRPVTRRWLLLLVIFILAGSAFTFWNWPTARTGFVFWFTALGLPFCLWGVMFSLRRLGYKAEQRATESRNVERDILLANEIRRGQRCAWILGSTVQTPAGREASRLVHAIADATPVPALIMPRGGRRMIRYAELSGFQDNFAEALESAVVKILACITRVAEKLPSGIPCWLIIDGDDQVALQAGESIKRDFTARTGLQFCKFSGSGMEAFDSWLDRYWDIPSLLIVITLSFPPVPEEGGTDAITAVILCNRQSMEFPQAIQLHRPEKGHAATLTSTLAKALLWSRLSAQYLRGAWVTGPLLLAGSEWNTACEQNGVTFSLTENNSCLDPVLGYAGKASVWLAVTMAAAAFDERGEQVVAAQTVADKDEIWVVVLSRQHGLKETPGNV